MSTCIIGGTDGSVARWPSDLLFPMERKCPAVAEDLSLLHSLLGEKGEVRLWRLTLSPHTAQGSF